MPAFALACGQIFETGPTRYHAFRFGKQIVTSIQSDRLRLACHTCRADADENSGVDFHVLVPFDELQKGPDCAVSQRNLSRKIRLLRDRPTKVAGNDRGG